MRRKKIFLLLLVFCLLAATAFAENIIGRLKKVKGTGRIVRPYEQIAAEDGVGIMLGDQLITETDGAMGVVFTDNTRLSLGPDSSIRIARYIYSPEKSIFSFFMKKIQGTASYISGAIGRLAPNSVRIQTPTAMVGIRGTFFLMKADAESEAMSSSAEKKDMFVLMPDPESNITGSIAVTNDIGSISLSKPHEAVRIAEAEHPEPPVILSQKKIQAIFHAALQALPESKNGAEFFLPFALMRDFPDALRETIFRSFPELKNNPDAPIPFALRKNFHRTLKQIIVNREK